MSKLTDYIANIASAFAGNAPVALTRQDLGWVNVAGSTYEAFKANDYENAYPSITKITNKLMVIKPYTINGDADKVDSALQKALYHPNTLNSSVEFREALGLMYLVHPKTHILVWRNEGGRAVAGGKITPDNIAGFTFMEGVSTINVNGKTQYTLSIGDGSRTFTDEEVITLRGLNPYAINSGGYSATRAASKWTTIDDYIAQYQKGFFENGAVPTGQFVITAATAQEFKDIVNKLQDRHRGAGKNNNVTYTHRPIDQASGKPVNAQIEWIPFATPNKELSLEALFAQANMKIDSVYGVPASIRCVGENNNFATAQMDKQNFMEDVVDPIALKIWTAFTHELNRITGGLGVMIHYDIEIPGVSEDDKVKEETKKILDERVQAWLDKGYSITSIKQYLESGDLEDLETIEVVDEPEDDPDIDEGDEVEGAPNPNEAVADKITNEIHCSACDRFLGNTEHESITDELKCSNTKCKALAVPTVKIVKAGS